MPETAKTHWSEQKEISHSPLPLIMMTVMCRTLPSWLLRAVAWPVSFFYYLCVPKVRTVCAQYQKQVIAYSGTKALHKPHVYTQVLAFSLTLIEKMQGWNGSIYLKKVHFQNDDVQDLIARLNSGKGAVVIMSHLGNAELMRSLIQFNRTAVSRPFPVITIGDVQATANFNRMLKYINPAYDMKMITSSMITPATIEQLQQHIASGGLVVFSGDRTSAASKDRIITEPFLGKNAAFSYGAFFLCALLGVPVYFIFALRSRDTGISFSYDLHIHKSRTAYSGIRKERNAEIEKQCGEFAALLQTYCLQHPLQWYNFYDFWALPDTVNKENQ